MNTLSVVFGMLLLGSVTFLYRFSFVHSKGRKLAEKIPEDFLKLLAPATFAAIIMNSLMAQQSQGQFLDLKSFVAILSFGIAYLTRSIMLTMVFGLGLLYLLQNL